MQQISNLREIQLIQIEILKYFKSVCEKHGIRYYLSNGTLLGAVKYHGFIPWDDDIDVFIPRSDYERLIRLPEFTDGQYVLLSDNRTPGWIYPYSKLSDSTTYVREGAYNLGVNYGVSIDLFPLDAWRGSKCRSRFQALRCGLLRRFLAASVSESFQTPKTGAAKLILFLIWRFSRLVGSQRLRHALLQEIESVRNEKSPRFVGSVAWSLYGVREVIPADVFSEQITLMFEGEAYQAPAGYDMYLRSLYNDYTQDLPPEKQVPHHSMTAWRLSD